MLKIKKLVVAGLLGLGLLSPFVATNANALTFPTIEGGYMQTYEESSKFTVWTVILLPAITKLHLETKTLMGLE